MTEDEMVAWHHRHNGHEFGCTLGVGGGQGGLACCSSWGHKESDMTERLSTQHLIREVKKFSPSQIILLLIIELLIYCWNLFERSSGPG